ncbi:GntR family transcriptional regulator [Neorhizobium sp. T786]|uniref:GntR family transcriptional regulator n=1 Tax=Pseudorhizobium xiangyangii TaxID=2883104 RepID=UPI001CFF7094|nr:GntR family transcriptional regulator [Neorhizobium xiangyangii]MCB5205536.1 GntR family transcriptional regulator [Neorhizobium xiangyangii]
MPDRFVSPALQGMDITSFLTVPLAGVEAEIYNGIWNAVIDRKLQSGMKLEEAALGEIYGVSRTVIRKVLVIMEQDGIVELPLNRGAYVASPSREDGLQVLEAASVLYQHFARKLALNPKGLTDQDRERIQLHLQAEERAHNEQKVQASRRMRSELGTLLGLLSGNALLAGTMARYMVRAILALSLHQKGPAPDSRALGKTIVDAISKGDAEKAVETIRIYSALLMQSMNLVMDDHTADLRSILGHAAKPR